MSENTRKTFSSQHKADMDGRCGRTLYNIFRERLWRSVNHEDVYLKEYINMQELQLTI